MEMELKRRDSENGSTVGELFVDGSFFCYTLEDQVREVDGEAVSTWKVKGETAIPRGSYEVRLTMSPRFKKIMPQLLNVPGFTGVRIHSGNTASDTEGCILVGMSAGSSTIQRSREAYEALYTEIQAAIDSGEKVHIDITDAEGV